MRILVALIGALLSIPVCYVFCTNKSVRRDFLVGPESSLRPLRYGLVSGFLVGAFFLALLLVGALLDASYNWTVETVLGLVAFAAFAGLFVGILMLLSTAWTFFVVGRYRGFLDSHLTKQQRQTKAQGTPTDRSKH